MFRACDAVTRSGSNFSRTHIHMRYIPIRIQTRIRIHTYCVVIIYLPMHMRTLPYTPTYILIQIHLHMHIPIPTHIHTRVHTLHMHALSRSQTHSHPHMCVYIHKYLTVCLSIYLSLYLFHLSAFTEVGEIFVASTAQFRTVKCACCNKQSERCPKEKVRSEVHLGMKHLTHSGGAYGVGCFEFLILAISCSCRTREILTPHALESHALESQMLVRAVALPDMLSMA